MRLSALQVLFLVILFLIFCTKPGLLNYLLEMLINLLKLKQDKK
jgi:hypothetical protein